MQTTHTPGPWTVAGREIIGPQDSGVIVARLPEWGILADNPDPAPANARLIASAPALLAALQEIANYDPTKWDAATLGNIARAAIARATGED